MNEYTRTKGKIRLSKIPDFCPVCGSKKIATYLRGLPFFTEELENDIKQGRVILAGCCIADDDPFCICIDCKTDFYEDF